MLFSLIKFFFIVLCCFVLQHKAINKKIFFKDWLFMSGASLATGAAIAVICRTPAEPLFILMFIVVIIYPLIRFKFSLVSAINVSMFSLAAEFVILIISLFASLPITYFFYRYDYSSEAMLGAASAVIGIINVISCSLFFKIKRFRHGIPLVEKNIRSDLTTLIYVIIITLSLSVYYIVAETYITYLIIMGVLICGCILFLIYRVRIQSIYVEKVNQRNKEIEEATMSDIESEKQRLLDENKNLSSIVHKDNKIIPAMYMAVNEILDCDSADLQKEKAAMLKNQLAALTDERKEFLTEFETKNQALPSTGVSSTDACIKYLYNKAKKSNACFTVSATSNLNKYKGFAKCENDFNTMLLDLGENAIISLDDVDFKNVFLLVDASESNLTLSFFDSGDMFAVNVIRNLGLKRTTTHKKTGGTGIGLMNTFKLCRKYKASFVLDETVDNSDFGKSVSIVFDGLEQVRIKSNRPEVVKILIDRNDIVQEKAAA